VRLADTLRLALRNLRESVLRTVLTALGVAIGVASLVGMVSFGVALQDQITGSFLRSGVFDAITVTSAQITLPGGGAPFGGGRRQGGRGRAAARPPADRPKLDDDTLKRFAALPHVREAYPELRVPVEVKFAAFSEFSAARGVPMSARGEGVFQDLQAGRFFDRADEDACLISVEFARRLSEGEPASLIGKDLTLVYAKSAQDGTKGTAAPAAPAGAPPGEASSGTDAAPGASGIPGLGLPVPGGLNIQRAEARFRIVGIVVRQGGPGAGAAGGLGLFSAVMIPLAKAREMGGADLSNPQAILRQLADRRTYATATVRVERPQDTEEVERAIKDMGFGAFSVADVMQSQKRAFILLDLLLGLVGSIALTVASLGIVNTMVMSILERTREIGVMKAIGAGDGDVRRIFLIEAALIGLTGGIAGVALGWGVGRLINIGANIYLERQGVPAANLFLIPWWLTAGGILFAVMVGLIAGGFPASRAARLDPIQALRHD
jgi:putative ABC transport system permease protein